MYKTFRIARIIIVSAVTCAVTLSLLNVGGLGTAAGRWLADMQIVPALLTCSAGWLVFWLAVTLVAGRLYCSTACPLGAVMDIAATLSQRLRPRSARGPRYRYRPGYTWLRFLMLICLIEAAGLGMTTLIGILDPAADFRRLTDIFLLTSATGILGAIAVLAVIIAATARHGRILCNTICPVGAMLGGISRVSLLAFDINPDICTHCGECERVCKSQCIKSQASTIDNTRCVTCFNCTDICPAGAISWRVGRHRLQWPLLQRIATRRAAGPRYAVTGGNATDNDTDTRNNTPANETISATAGKNPHRRNTQD